MQEKAPLGGAMAKAAESVPTNIVEGCGAFSRKEFARFLDISIKSTFELEYQLQLAKDNRVLLQEPWRKLTRETIEIRRMLCAYRRSVINAIVHKSSNKSEPSTSVVTKKLTD